MCGILLKSHPVLTPLPSHTIHDISDLDSTFSNFILTSNLRKHCKFITKLLKHSRFLATAAVSRLTRDHQVRLPDFLVFLSQKPAEQCVESLFFHKLSSIKRALIKFGLSVNCFHFCGLFQNKGSCICKLHVACTCCGYGYS